MCTRTLVGCIEDTNCFNPQLRAQIFDQCKAVSSDGVVSSRDVFFRVLRKTECSVVLDVT